MAVGLTWATVILIGFLCRQMSFQSQRMAELTPTLMLKVLRFLFLPYLYTVLPVLVIT